MACCWYAAVACRRLKEHYAEKFCSRHSIEVTWTAWKARSICAIATKARAVTLGKLAMIRHTWRIWSSAACAAVNMRTDMHLAQRRCRQIRLVWTGWQQQQCLMADQRALFIRSLLQRKLRRSFSCWHECVASARELSVKKHLVACQHHRKKALGKPLMGWAHVAGMKVCERQFVSFNLHRAAHRRQACAFLHWLHVVAEACRDRTGMELSGGFARTRYLRVFFGGWQWHAAAVQHAKEHRCELKLSVNTVVLKWIVSLTPSLCCHLMTCMNFTSFDKC
jgi:hypothetical protein